MHVSRERLATRSHFYVDADMLSLDLDMVEGDGTVVFILKGRKFNKEIFIDLAEAKRPVDIKYVYHHGEMWRGLFHKDTTIKIER